jgi:tRNA1Val (adenine37-N6)-methyltransferase
MANSWFQFQQFKVEQVGCAMKVGTDGVLLGAWAGGGNAYQKALDIGSGTGLLGLMLCQRFGCDVTAVEVAADGYAQGQANFLDSPWPSKFTALHADVTQLSLATQFDLVVSNPPYFNGTYLPQQQPRALARHQGAGLTMEQLFQSAIAALSPIAHARFAVILPFEAYPTAQAHAEQVGLHLLRRCDVRGHTVAPIKRLLLEWGRNPSALVYTDLVLEEKRGLRSAAYQELTRGFYL